MAEVGPVLEEAAPPATLGEALQRLQGEVGELDLVREATGQVGSRFFKYLTLDKLLAAIRPLLAANGLVWQTFPTTLEGKPALRYRLLHTATGEEIGDTMLLAVDKMTSQAQGSAITYARRHALLSVLEIQPDPDDDGTAASQPARPAPVDPEAPLSEETTRRMMEGIAERQLDAEEMLRNVGVKPGTVPTVEQGKRVSALLKEHDERQAAG